MTTKVTIEINGTKVSAEVDNIDLTVDEMFDLIRSAFLGCTYSWEQWHQGIAKIYHEGE